MLFKVLVTTRLVKPLQIHVLIRFFCSKDQKQNVHNYIFVSKVIFLLSHNLKYASKHSLKLA